MTVDELRATCAEIIDEVVKLGFPAEQANLTLVTPQGWKAPPKFPRGKLLQVKEDGRRVWAFKAQRIMAWVDAQ